MTQSLHEINVTAHYSTTEVAKLMGVDRSTIARWVERGMLKCGYRRHNHRRFYEGYELVRFLKAKPI